MSYQSTALWQNFGGTSEDCQHPELCSELKQEFTKMRANAAYLTGEISKELPEFTVHSIEHLDALWRTSDQVMGTMFTNNPLETFILGASFLIHDAGMTLAAYPGGMTEVKASREWRKLERRAEHERFLDDTERERAVLGLFLREQHAKRAEELPLVSWSTKQNDGERYLIHDPEIRQKFGQVIGEVSASHWWSHDELEARFSRIKPAPAGYPIEWSIDLLKIACVLRCADAANIDGSRAPGFLWALRKGQISDYSNQHWKFQNNLSQPELRHGDLVYGSLNHFEKKDAAEWWLAHDTLKMVDTELKTCDAILKRHTNHAYGLGARRVANIDSPSMLKTMIEVRGWEPVDTAFTVADLPRLVERLGGSQLYGNDSMAPVRELIQNGMDAVRVRRAVDRGFEDGAVHISVPKIEEGETLVFDDDGVGMTGDGVVRNLLSFGQSGWLSDPAIGVYTDLFPDEAHVSGRYGIGFFSVFMLGDRVGVITRRWDARPEETVVLEFEEGIKSRPILYLAEREEQRTQGGTRIEVVLKEGARPFVSVAEKDGQLSAMKSLSGVFPASDVLLKISDRGEVSSVDGRNWKSEPAVQLLARIAPELSEEWVKAAAAMLSDLVDTNGNVVGRASLVAPEFTKKDENDWLLEAAMRPLREITGGYPGGRQGIFEGCVSHRGTRLGKSMNHVGIIEGVPARASRDRAIIELSEESFKAWVVDQLTKLNDLEPTEYGIGLLVVTCPPRLPHS